MRKPGDYIKDIFKKMDIRQIREFILFDSQDFHVKNESYNERLMQSSDPIFNRLRSLYTDNAEHEKAESDLSHALTTHEAVYMELGMKAGARLIYQLLLNDDECLK